MMPQQGFLYARGNATDDDYEDDVVTVDNVAIKHDKNKRGQQLQNQHQNQQHDYDIKCYSFVCFTVDIFWQLSLQESNYIQYHRKLNKK